MHYKTQPAATPSERKFVVMMGLPAAGKSTVASRRFPTFTRIDCDEVKKTHADYDPTNPQAIHAWSQAVVAEMLDGVFSNPTESVIYDSTGTNLERVTSILDRAEAAGYNTEVCFVTVPLVESFRRNSLRPRQVPEQVIRVKAGIIASVAQAVKGIQEGKSASFIAVDNSVWDESLRGAEPPMPVRKSKRGTYEAPGFKGFKHERTDGWMGGN